jgi:hypothetical protein
VVRALGDFLAVFAMIAIDSVSKIVNGTTMTSLRKAKWVKHALFVALFTHQCAWITTT